MSIVAFCPQGHRVKVKNTLAGRKGVCPECHTRFRLPLESCTIPIARLLSLDATWAAALARAVILPADHAFQKQAVRRVDHRPLSRPAAPADHEPPAAPAPCQDAGLHPMLAAQPEAVWYIATPGGQPSPPHTVAEMHAWLAAGLATGVELVWRSDWADWVSIRLVFPEHAPDA